MNCTFYSFKMFCAKTALREKSWSLQSVGDAKPMWSWFFSATQGISFSNFENKFCIFFFIYP
jgi:hypothetical protein